MLFTKIFHSKSCFSEKKFFFKIVLFEIARKTQNLRLLRGKMKKRDFFECKKFFKICPTAKEVHSKTDAL